MKDKLKATRYNKIDIKDLVDSVEQQTDVDVSNQTTMNAANILIIKRDGRREPFKPSKLAKCIEWATDDRPHFTEELLRDTAIKLHKEIKIRDMYKQLIITAVNKISLIAPEWEMIASKLQLLSIYKETYGISKRGNYPSLKVVLDRGLKHHVYDPETVNSLDEEEIQLLNDAIVQTRDYLFTYKSLTTFFDKYCMNYSKTKKLELPQFTYMRVAIAMMIGEKTNRVDKMIECYDALSQHHFTVATPIIMNAMTPKQQLSSCVLNTMHDDTHSILDVTRDLGVYSKFKGGTAIDISALRAKGAFIKGTHGISSGPVPFIKIVEATMKAFNQGGKRPGACCAYFPWWHLDVVDLLSLKSNGGTDENRARGLKYGIKLNELFIDAILNDEDITLFDPGEASSLIGIYGEEFNAAYKVLCDKNIRQKKMSARLLLEKIMKERTETGNIYLFHEENVNNVSMLNRYVGCSNLCTEITLPSRASTLLSEKLQTDEEGNTTTVKTYETGEIALCNLSSINLCNWSVMDRFEKRGLVDIIVRMLDNTIDLAKYPVKEGAYSNKMYRYLGIGVLNFANMLADKEIVFDSQEALEYSAYLFDELSYFLIDSSCDLAIEKGRFPKFHETKWSEGLCPVFFANNEALALTKYQPSIRKWQKLTTRVAQNGLRNATLMAIAPTATSGKSINATESTEPIQDFLYKEEGTTTITTLVPNFSKNNRFYVKSFDCDQNKLVELAAIRQIYLDQAQSINLYIKRPDSLLELTKLHLRAFKLGVKTLYYVKQQKGQDEEECESCT